MHKVILSAIVAMLFFSAGRAAGEETYLFCAWERGATFELKISDSGVIKNGRAVSDKVSTSGDLIRWHETPIPGTDYEYNVDRHTGVLIASGFSNMSNRKVENKALCVKLGGGAGTEF